MDEDEEGCYKEHKIVWSTYHQKNCIYLGRKHAHFSIEAQWNSK